MSTDKRRELINELEQDGTTAILITYVPSGPNGELEIGDALNLLGASQFDNETMARRLLAIALHVNHHLGLLPKGVVEDLSKYSVEPGQDSPFVV